MNETDVELERPEVLPRVLSDRYRLDAKIGQGGMGVVYVGYDMTMRRPIAVKLIRGEATGDDEAINRFLREAKNTARIQHEHIVEVFDLGRSGVGELYFVMEYLQGESLSTRLKREGRLHPRLVVHLGAQVCNALEFAHRHGIIHRDLKPGNLMIVRRSTDEHFVKVLDFGVAKSQDQHTQLTRTGMLVGTVEYMAPEQIIGKQVDARTDIYSLGVLLYRALAGTPPFKDSGVPALINAHINQRPDSLLSRAPNVGISRALDEVILKCLAKRPEQRFRSMAELASAMRAAIEEPPADEEPFPSGQQTIVARPSGVDEVASTRIQGATPAPDGVSVAFDLGGVAPVDPMDATRHEGGGTKKCRGCGADNPKLTAACKKCGAPMVTGSSEVRTPGGMTAIDEDEDFSDMIETQVLKTKVMPPRGAQGSEPPRVPLAPPAAGAPPPMAPPAPPPPLTSGPVPPPPMGQPSSPRQLPSRPPLGSVPGHTSPSGYPAAQSHAGYPPGPISGVGPHSGPHSAPHSNPPRTSWPAADPASLRPLDPHSRTGPTVRSREGGITWKRVVIYLFLLVLFANMCAERNLGSLIIFLGGAFLVSVGWLIVRARES